MRLCRYQDAESTKIGIYGDASVLDLIALANLLSRQHLASQLRIANGNVLPLLPPDGPLFGELLELLKLSKLLTPEQIGPCQLARESVTLLPPIDRPNKLLLLAGNYTEHILEQGDLAAEQSKTFPYVFSKPPSTTLVGDGAKVKIPDCSPDKIDHEVELAVVMGRRARNVSAEEALAYVAGYTIINDLSDRGFRPNPTRQERPRDKFFDWLHGKWHDGFCPCGPCILTADEVSNPQMFPLQLKVDGELRQSGSTSQQVFSVAEVISFISSFVTLEAGDILSTGTPSGVGNASGRYLQRGQRVEASIDRIGTLVTHLV